MEKITHRWLCEKGACEKGACEEQRKLFRKLYPKGISVCWQCFREAQNQGLDVRWLSYFARYHIAVPYSIRHRHFPELDHRDPDGHWEIPLVNVKTLKLLERALLEL